VQIDLDDVASDWEITKVERHSPSNLLLIDEAVSSSQGEACWGTWCELNWVLCSICEISILRVELCVVSIHLSDLENVGIKSSQASHNSASVINTSGGSSSAWSTSISALFKVIRKTVGTRVIYWGRPL
jgi:hypothetical protein